MKFKNSNNNSSQASSQVVSEVPESPNKLKIRAYLQEVLEVVCSIPLQLCFNKIRLSLNTWRMPAGSKAI